MMLVQRYQVLIPGTCVYYHMHRKSLTVVTKLKPLTWGGDYLGCCKNPVALCLQLRLMKVCHTQRSRRVKTEPKTGMMPPQAKGHEQQPEMGRKERESPTPSRRTSAQPTLD